MAKSGTSGSDVESDDKGGNCCSGDSSPPAKQLTKNDATSMDYVVAKPVKTTTHISILIESLIKNLCYFYERDEKNAKKIYNYICEKLFEMNLVDESYNMVEFEGMRNQYQTAFHHLVTTARGGEQTIPFQPSWPDNELSKEWSHYFREFEEIEFIAGGGFGQVYRVKHKLDGTEYAIKKIYIRSEGIRSVMNYLSEVKTFASLNHANIVQYKAAWLELGAPTTSTCINEPTGTYYSYPVERSVDENQNSNEKDKKSEHIDDYIYPNFVSELEHSVPETVDHESTDFEVSFKSSSDFKSKHYSFSNFSYNNSVRSKRDRDKRNSISEGGSAVCKIEEIQNLQIEARNSNKWATLYIQMSLCQTTLKQWLEARNRKEVSEKEAEVALVPVNDSVQTAKDHTIMEILKQLLRGLEYIHSKKIVHHDIKPSNIFMEMENGSLLVQLGDFGLACPLQSARHSLAFGTKLYAAPEQLLGKCEPKSDMYSLGIVLFELISCFKTDMERVESINHLRKGDYSQLDRTDSQFAPIIKELMSRNPGIRPNAANLLQRLCINESDSEIVRDLKNQLMEKEQEINRLKELLKSAGFEDINQ